MGTFGFSFGWLETSILVAISVSSIIATRYFLSFYQGTDSRDTRWKFERARHWDFSPEELGFTYRGLAIISVVSLFLELLMIRWISSEIRIFAFLKNFVLIACFLGFGIGCYFSRRKVSLLPLFGPLLFLALLIKLPWPPLRRAFAAIPMLMGSGSEVNYWGIPSFPRTWETFVLMLTSTGIVIPLIALLVFIFVPIGQLVGWHLESAPRGIKAYTINVLGSLAGIMLYTTVSFLHQPPAIWLFISGLTITLALWRLPRQRWSAALLSAACVVVALLPPPVTDRGRGWEYWSPYQKLTIYQVNSNGETTSYQLSTNDSWHQQVLNLSDSFLGAHPELVGSLGVKWNAYNIPYRFAQSPSDVLVLGSGMGNDVAAAVRNGAGHITAVEIDPLILELGRELHFEKPYSSPRVTTVLDDARSYIQNSDEQFDLIVFSLLDSHTSTSHYTNIRIDNFVYTVEALQAAKRLLKPDGLFVVKFQVNTPWIAGRLNELLKRVFGHSPIEFQVPDSDQYATGGRFYLTGTDQRISKILAEPSFARFIKEHGNVSREKAALTTDDWPYFYQHEPGLPLNVICLSIMVLLMFVWFLRRTAPEGISVGIEWHFFFLGAGFLLLEAQIVSKMALLFGTTWIVNSIVISFLFLVIVLANSLVNLAPNVSVPLAYSGMFVSMAVSYVVPPQAYFFSNVYLKGLTAGLILCLPVFFASIIFVRRFATVKFSAQALGSNLFGALVGGILESLSFWFGLKFLLILAACLYAASAVTRNRGALSSRLLIAKARG